MTDIYIGELGITRLRQLASILQLPGYSKYKDAGSLREYISTVLTKTHMVRIVYLRQIGKTRDQINIEAKKIIELIQKKRQKGVISSDKSGSLHEYKIMDSVSELERCMKDLAEANERGIAVHQPLPAELIKALQQYLPEVPNEDQQVIHSLLNKAKELDQVSKKYDLSRQQCENLKRDALDKLQEFERSMKDLTNRNAQLVSQVENLPKMYQQEKAQIIKNNEEALSTQAFQVQQLTIRNTALLEELATLKTVLGELQAKLDGKDIGSTKFSAELNDLHHELDKVQQTNKQLSLSLERLTTLQKESSLLLKSTSEKLANCESNRQNAENVSKRLQTNYNTSLDFIRKLEEKLKDSSLKGVKHQQGLIKAIKDLRTKGQQCQTQLASLQQKQKDLEDAGHLQQIEGLREELQKANILIATCQQNNKDTLSKMENKFNRCVELGKEMKRSMTAQNQATLLERNRLQSALDQALVDHQQKLSKEKERSDLIQQELLKEKERSDLIQRELKECRHELNYYGIPNVSEN